MTVVSPAGAPAASVHKSGHPEVSGRSRLRGLARLLSNPLRLLWGMIFMQSFLGSFLILGWSNEAIRRRALKSWWRKRPDETDQRRFPEFLEAHPDLDVCRSWPNWFVENRIERPGQARALADPGRWLASVGRNFWSGLGTALNTWAVTLPPCALWTFGWYFGWNNSFYKGYELSAIGPVTGLAGVFLFMGAMFFVPLAQARQAVTGDWRSFYEWSLLRRLMREGWPACLLLALLYAVLFVPVIVLKTLPGFFSNMNPALLEATPLQVTAILNRYFFWSALLVFPVFVFLRLAAARVYASALLRALYRGSIQTAELAPRERLFLGRLGLFKADPAAPVPAVSGLFRAGAGALIRTLATLTTAAFWFAFVALVFVGQFFTNQGLIGWLNQPLVQLPWFRYFPMAVRDVRGELFLSLLLVAVLTLAVRAWSLLRRPAASPS